ncbi:hypothetical protein [Pseudoroseicyclus tamaricis]|uniref:Uncharacterized protein n=1 Tax=Pseudoroseicyclus tamaricis TaxID=2705421 RepID=A0A6B2JNC7_9RHOB|nr:hypothetical protein [Pseudoroseicyclus tamaricis]NDU99537.1 hypothetical protein [Pseudoroseicyclus tamaricis]
MEEVQMPEVKLSLKLGALSIDCEASEEFMKTDLNTIIEQLLELDLPDTGALSDSGTTSITSQSAPSEGQQAAKLSTTDFAVKMGAKSGSDLLMAAAANLYHTQGKEEFRRGDVLNEMKGAKAFYRASYGSNLSKSLETLTKSGKLQNPRSDTYALPYAEIQSTKRHL